MAAQHESLAPVSNNIQYPDPYAHVENLLKQKSLSNVKIIFAMIGGSHAYNCQLDSGKSDFDFLGVFVAPTSSILSLSEVRPEQVVTQSEPNDMTVVEVGKFCEMVQTGNPLALQMLFTKRFIYTTPEFEELRAEADKFITKQTVEAYMGYIKSQLKQVQGKVKYDYSKFLYHAFRLLFELEHIVINSQLPIIYFENGTEERNFLMHVRQQGDAQTRNKLLDQIQTRLQAIQNLKPWNNVRETAVKPGSNSFTVLNNWLLQIRKAN